MSKINVDGISGNLEAIKSNVLDGDLGTRGEQYAAAQFALLLCILGGGIPVIGDALMLHASPSHA